MRNRNRGDLAKLEMTPMIDVVFQLLIFFIVTLKAQDVLAHLNVARPSPSEIPPPPELNLLEIQIGADGWVLNGRPFSGTGGFANMERHLARIASFSRDASVLIKCTDDAPHAFLVRTLNACAREGMTKVSLFNY